VLHNSRQYAGVHISVSSLIFFHKLCFSRDSDSYTFIIEGTLARRLYENLRRQAGALRIQTRYRMRQERNKFRDLCSASTTIQCGLRGMAARNKLRFYRQTKAAVIIQVFLRLHV
jgi:hypothetical protein